MNINNSINGSGLYAPVGTALTPVQPTVSTPQSPNLKRESPESYPQAVLASTRASRESIQAKAELLIQRQVHDDSLSHRNRTAVAAYRSLNETEERDSISAILGVDEYA